MEDFTLDLLLNDSKKKYLPGDHVKGIVTVKCANGSTNTPINLRLIWAGNATSQDKDSEDSFPYFLEAWELENQTLNSDPSELVFPEHLSFQPVNISLNSTYVLPSSLALDGICSFEFDVIVPTRLYLPGTIKTEETDITASITYSIVAHLDQYEYPGNIGVAKAEVILAETFNHFYKSGFQSKTVKYSVGTLSNTSTVQEYDYSASLSIHILNPRAERGGVTPLIVHITTDCSHDRDEIITYLLVRICSIRIQESNCQFNDTVVWTKQETINMKQSFHQNPKKLDRFLEIPDDILPTITNNDGIFEVNYKVCVMVSGNDTVYAAEGLPENRYVIVDTPLWIDSVSKENIELVSPLHRAVSDPKKDDVKKRNIMDRFKRQIKPDDVEPLEPVKPGFRESSKGLFSFGRSKAKNKKSTSNTTPPESPSHNPITVSKSPPSTPPPPGLDSNSRPVQRVLSTASSISYRSFISSPSLGKYTMHPGISERGTENMSGSENHFRSANETYTKPNTSEDTTSDGYPQGSTYTYEKASSQASFLHNRSCGESKASNQHQESEIDILYRNILGPYDNTPLYTHGSEDNITSSISMAPSIVTSEGGVETHDMFDDSDDEDIEEYQARMKALEIRQMEEQQRFTNIRSNSQRSNISNVRLVSNRLQPSITSNTLLYHNHDEYISASETSPQRSNDVFTANGEYDLDDDSSSDEDELIHQAARYNEQQLRLGHYRN